MSYPHGIRANNTKFLAKKYIFIEETYIVLDKQQIGLLKRYLIVNLGNYP
jgi:hypothetical protein